MLKLRCVKKDYIVGDETVHALKGIDLVFRESEFVSILGPSGCGKTTLLNIIGGLDQYTSGDLIINGESTKNFKDRDWDTYRNHSVGFVFQSYNLIPHQTVLQNVELALTISGISRQERIRRAERALEQVGLGSQMNKRPNQMSGGQMQRVAIARALVNDPDIILADEPTGALDTETGVQVMEILQKVSRNRLVIMVTHNPELAEKYSTRIIRVLDGKITDDSGKVSDEEYKQMEQKAQSHRELLKNEKKPSMSFKTACGLSLKNLVTKKGRTILTAFAGCIGILGIALIIAVSQGATDYIDSVQEEALSSLPLSIQKTTVSMESLMDTFAGSLSSDMDHQKDAVYKKSAVYDMLTAMNDMETGENDLESFKAWLEEKITDEEELGEAVNGVQYSYDLGILVYTQNVDGNIVKSDTQSLLQDLMTEYMGMDMSAAMSTMEDSAMSGLMESMESAGSMIGGTMASPSGTLWQELLPGKDGEPVNELLKKQYDVVYGDWPSKYNEIVLVLDENNELDDMSLYALGLESKDYMDKIMEAAIDGTELEKEDARWSYDEICSAEYKVILNPDCFHYDEEKGCYTDLRETEAGLKYLYDNGLELKVKGIIRPKEDAEVSMLSGSVAYTKGLTEYVIEHAKESDAVKAQLDSKDMDILTGLPFPANTNNLSEKEKAEEIRQYLSGLNEAGKAEAYVKMKSIPSEQELDSMTKQAMAGVSDADKKSALSQAMAEQMGMDEASISDYMEKMDSKEIDRLFREAVTEQVKVQYAQQAAQQLGVMEQGEQAAALEQEIEDCSDTECALYYDEILTFSESDYEANLNMLGYVDMDSPAEVNIYASSFENKGRIEDAIDEYNEGKEEIDQITYTDLVGIMMSSVTSIIDIITWVLLAFVAISLVVSSIMIGVITLISVQERTKEIGILRAIGASRHDVSSIFNAETMLIGLASGLLGVGITYLLCIPVNLVLHNLTGVETLNAVLPPLAAVCLVLLSIALSVIAGLVPAKSAARKNPVIALRTE